MNAVAGISLLPRETAKYALDCWPPCALLSGIELNWSLLWQSKNRQWEELHTSFRLTQPFKQEQCKLINAISLIATLYSSPSVWISVSPDHVTANTLLLCFYQIPNISFIECVWSVLESDWPVRCIFASSPVHFQHLFTWGIKYWVHKHIVLDTYLVWLAMHTLTSFHKDR